MKKNIFLFGSTGFIGSYFFNKYENNKKFKIIGREKTSNLYLYKNIENKFKSFWNKTLKKTDTIVYLSFNNNLDDINKNFEQNLIKTLIPLYTLNDTISLLKKKIKVIYLSTASIYGNQNKLPVNEKAKINILNRYDLLKNLSEEILIKSNNKFLNYQILRLSNVYGPNLSQKKQDNRQVVTKVIQNCFKNNEIKIFGNGNYYRDYVHVGDVSEIIKKIAVNDKIKVNQIYNIGSGEKIKLIDLFKKISNNIQKRIGKKITLKFIKNIDKNDQSIKRNYQSNLNKINFYLKWKPKISLDKGINDLISFTNEKN
jgi:nucleoside-diphosphate-sugar epimerase